MTDLPEFNYPAFFAAEKELTMLGYEVTNPADNPTQDTWEDYMRHDIKQLMDCHAVALLDGWEDSKGAGIEVGIALKLGFEVKAIGQFLTIQESA